MKSYFVEEKNTVKKIEVKKPNFWQTSLFICVLNEQLISNLKPWGGGTLPEGISAWLLELYEKTKLTQPPSISGLVKTGLAPGYTLARAPTTLAGCKQSYIKLLIILKQISRIRHNSHCTPVGLPSYSSHQDYAHFQSSRAFWVKRPYSMRWMYRKEHQQHFIDGITEHQLWVVFDKPELSMPQTWVLDEYIEAKHPSEDMSSKVCIKNIIRLSPGVYSYVLKSLATNRLSALVWK